ncbi:hypothetical protein D8878_11425 [Streptococcus sanguinis]|uniref:Uncharacterized protein n=1 Tax=Streptococcus sanguinis TaxID=1305 RepID=A0AB74DFI8_STRSA|nr:hypothetical protein D8879_11760 [Streptococcus sanguinis]RSI31236.1 hypothetical protein D8878_11425 [Streptococcus sanguinis]
MNKSIYGNFSLLLEVFVRIVEFLMFSDYILWNP